jgi:hypothetical protein
MNVTCFSQSFSFGNDNYSLLDIFVVSLVPKDDSIGSKRRRPHRTNAVNYKRTETKKIKKKK